MKTADYGIDKPERVRALAMVGLVLIGTGLSQFIALQASVEIWPELILSICLWIGVLLLIVAGVMLWSSKTGKFGLAWKMLEDMRWRGREKVLDVGCGRGLLTILAARKAPLGEILGIDIWSQEQLSENTREAAQENAEAERVTDRVRFEDGDVNGVGEADQTSAARRGDCDPRYSTHQGIQEYLRTTGAAKHTAFADEISVLSSDAVCDRREGKDRGLREDVTRRRMGSTGRRESPDAPLEAVGAVLERTAVGNGAGGLFRTRERLGLFSL